FRTSPSSFGVTYIWLGGANHVGLGRLPTIMVCNIRFLLQKRAHAVRSYIACSRYRCKKFITGASVNENRIASSLAERFSCLCHPQVGRANTSPGNHS